MDNKSKERGILKPAVMVDTTKSELTPQGSCDYPPSSPQPSVDRLSVTWAEPGSMSSGVNFSNLPCELPLSNEVKFSQAAEDGSEDEDYSASLSAVLRQRRASIRRSRKGRSRRPSSPFLGEDVRSRRRSSVFTTSSGDTAISMEEPVAVVTQEEIFENIHLHKEVLGSVKQQPLGMRRKLKIVHQAKGYIKRHQGQLQERLAQSKSTRDIYARFNILLNTKWQQLKREAANTSNLLIPWELRIKEIESHFGSVVASYFTFLRWLFWVNLVIGFILLVFVIVPESLIANPDENVERKRVMDNDRQNASNLLTLWEFDGILKVSPIFYGFYSNIEVVQYRMPLAYFLTGLAVYIYSFVAILRKMAENSRMSKLSEKEDECIFSWKLFTGWDFMIGNTETAHNRIASVILGFKEALLEEAEKKRDSRNWRIISLRAIVNICVIILLAVSASAVVTVVSRSDDNIKDRGWISENETTIVVTLISITFPFIFELLGYLEHCHPRKQLRLQLARIMLLNLLNLYSLIFALFSKIDGMSTDLNSLKPELLNLTIIKPNGMLNYSGTLHFNESMFNTPGTCFEESVSCEICYNNIELMTPMTMSVTIIVNTTHIDTFCIACTPLKINTSYHKLLRHQREDRFDYNTPDYGINKELASNIQVGLEELKKIKELIKQHPNIVTEKQITSTESDYDYNFYDTETTSDISGQVSDISSSGYTSLTYESNTEFNENVYKTDTEIKSSTVYDSKTIYDETDTTTDTTFSTTYGSYETQSYVDGTETTNDISDKINTAMMDITTNTYNTETDNKDLLITKSTEKGLNTNTTSETTRIHTVPTVISTKICTNMSCNSTILCKGEYVTQVYFISNCTSVYKLCYKRTCVNNTKAEFDTTAAVVNIDKDIAYTDDHNIKRYNLTMRTRKKLLKLCWETMFGQELVKLTMMDLVFVLLGTLFMDFFRALLVRYLNRCWCWDLEKKFPEYGDFKIAENILHLINNQGMVWMGMFFSPGLVVLNVVKLMIMMYLRSWAVMTCNVPHEVVFRVSKSNNFYLALLLTMLFLCVLPVGYTIVWVTPSWHCGPFSEYEKIYQILITYVHKLLPDRLHFFFLEYIASPAIVIPLLVLLILIIYYLTSLTNSLREANNDLKIQLRRERTEERRKMFQLVDTRRRGGSTAMENTPFARWKKALPTLPMSKSIDSDDRKPLTEETNEPVKTVKKRGGIFAKIVGMALDKKPEVVIVQEVDIPAPVDDETDTDFHETLPKEVLKIKDITITKEEQKKRISIEFKKPRIEDKDLKVKLEKVEDRTEKKAIIEKQNRDTKEVSKPKIIDEVPKEKNKSKKIHEKQASETSTQSRQSDSTVIPVITISTTESDDEVLAKSVKKSDEKKKITDEVESKPRRIPDLKSLRRQSSVESINEQKPTVKEKKEQEGPEGWLFPGPKYKYRHPTWQYSQHSGNIASRQ